MSKPMTPAARSSIAWRKKTMLWSFVLILAGSILLPSGSYLYVALSTAQACALASIKLFGNPSRTDVLTIIQLRPKICDSRSSTLAIRRVAMPRR